MGHIRLVDKKSVSEFSGELSQCVESFNSTLFPHCFSLTRKKFCCAKNLKFVQNKVLRAKHELQ